MYYLHVPIQVLLLLRSQYPQMFYPFKFRNECLFKKLFLLGNSEKKSTCLSHWLISEMKLQSKHLDWPVFEFVKGVQEEGLSTLNYSFKIKTQRWTSVSQPHAVLRNGCVHVFDCVITYRGSVDWAVCVVVMVAIFSAFVSREALEDSGKREKI